jgi:hypothetical protein
MMKRRIRHLVVSVALFSALGLLSPAAATQTAACPGLLSADVAGAQGAPVTEQVTECPSGIEPASFSWGISQ